MVAPEADIVAEAFDTAILPVNGDVISNNEQVPLPLYENIR